MCDGYVTDETPGSDGSVMDVTDVMDILKKTSRELLS
jgi:hypothetical protein